MTLWIVLGAVACSARPPAPVPSPDSAAKVERSNSTVAKSATDEAAPEPHDFQRLAQALRSSERRSAQRELRETIVEAGPDSVPAALLLADFYAMQESYGDAFAVIDAAIKAAGDDHRLTIARALLLRDIDHWADAANQLRPLCVGEAVPARALAELAEIEFVLERYEVSKFLVDRVLGSHASDSSIAATLPRMQELRTELQQVAAGRRRTASAIELFARVRGARDVGEREDALKALLAVSRVRPRALRAAFWNDAVTVRIAAIRALEARDDGYAELVKIALSDADPLVRGSAARAVDRLRLPASLLFEQLDAEENPYAFRRLHEALRRTVGPRVDLPMEAERSAEQRRITRHAWRPHWHR